MTPLPGSFLIVFGLLFAALVFAQDNAPDTSREGSYYVAAIELHTTAELHAVLERADRLLAQGLALQSDPATVTFVLHGPEVTSLLRQNYLKNKATVDLAARLSALGVVKIKACKTWMGGNAVAEEDLQPFVGTVEYGPEEIRRLVEQEDYLYF